MFLMPPTDTGYSTSGTSESFPGWTVEARRVWWEETRQENEQGKIVIAKGKIIVAHGSLKKL